MTKSIAYGLLAMAVSGSIALANGGEGDKKESPFQGNNGGVSWKPGSGITIDGGDEFMLNWSNQLQIQYNYAANENAAETNNFLVRRARTTFKGHVFNPNIGYMLQVDGVDTGASLKEGWISYNFVHDENAKIGVKTGQAKTGFGLDGTNTSSGLFFVERALATRVFADEYTRGAWLYGSYMENKLRWQAGAQNGDVSKGVAMIDHGEETANADNELDYELVVNFDPMGDYTGGKGNYGVKQGDLGDGTKDLVGTIGVGLFAGNGKLPAAFGFAQDVESTCFNVNTAWRVSGFEAMGEVFIRSDELDGVGGSTEDSLGWQIQGTYCLPKSGDSPMQWGVGLRASMVDTDNTSGFISGTPAIPLGVAVVAPGFGAGGEGTVTEITAVLDAFYHGHACKTQLEFTLQDVNNDVGTDSTNGILRLQFQLLF